MSTLFPTERAVRRNSSPAVEEETNALLWNNGRVNTSKPRKRSQTLKTNGKEHHKGTSSPRKTRKSKLPKPDTISEPCVSFTASPEVSDNIAIPNRHVSKFAGIITSPRDIPKHKPGFSKQGSTFEMSRVRVQKELDVVEQFIDTLPPLLDSEEGKAIFIEANEELQYFLSSMTQTQENIQLLVDTLLDSADYQTISNLIAMHERIDNLKKKYEAIQQISGFSDSEQHSDNLSASDARFLSSMSRKELISQYTISQLKDLLDDHDISYSFCIEKKELIDLVMLHGLTPREDDTSETTESEDTGEPVSCLICFEDYRPKQMYQLKCSHSYCKTCLRDYIVSKVSDGAVMTLDCPDPKCKKPFDVEDVATLAPDDVIKKYDQLKILAELNMNPNCRWCPRPGCNTAIIGDPSEAKLVCTQCQQEICFNCRQAWHEGKTCEEYAEWRKKHMKDEESWDEWAKENNAKQCPQCGVWIVRPTGCNQVVCKSCYFSFCWLCMKECIVPDHYQNGECSGKWFEETNLTTGQKIAAGIILGGVFIVASPILVLAGGIVLGRNIKKNIKKRKDEKKEEKEKKKEGKEVKKEKKEKRIKPNRPEEPLEFD